MHRGEHVDRPDGLGHAVLRREEVEVEDAAVVLDDHGLVAEEGDALELEQRVVERVREHVARPLGHHDGDHDEEQLRGVGVEWRVAGQANTCYWSQVEWLPRPGDYNLLGNSVSVVQLILAHISQ